jgi:hypothetical protein
MSLLGVPERNRSLCPFRFFSPPVCLVQPTAAGMAPSRHPGLHWAEPNAQVRWGERLRPQRKSIVSVDAMRVQTLSDHLLFKSTGFRVQKNRTNAVNHSHRPSLIWWPTTVIKTTCQIIQPTRAKDYNQSSMSNSTSNYMLFGESCPDLFPSQQWYDWPQAEMRLLALGWAWKQLSRRQINERLRLSARY